MFEKKIQFKFKGSTLSLTVVEINKDLKRGRRRPQRRLKKTKTIGLMIKTTALHVHHAF